MATLRGLWALTWLETKIFVREPLGVIGTFGFPILLFVVLQRMGAGAPRRSQVPSLLGSDLPVFAAVMMALSACISLVAVIAIYREGGILKRLRATPLRPTAILLAHVFVKLGFTALSLVLLVLVGARSMPTASAPWLSFTVALLYTTLCLLAVGFVVASLVPTARFAQPLATLVVYSMLGMSGLVVPIQSLPPVAQAVAHVLPLTYAVSLLRGVWRGDGWLAHGTDVAMLAVLFLALTAVASRVFRWE
ncbi:MAG TPA: ABC transporter permease [Luteitalea sp.]|nr:ABC transporter permease [Luteitalea sp.]